MSSSQPERVFQANVVRELKALFPGCMVLPLDSAHMPGVPDRIVLYNDKWATLEFKQHERARKQPNQEYYVELMDEMSFSRFISPENKEEVLHELQQALKPGRRARVSRRE